MIVYTVKDRDGNIFPKAILELPCLGQAVRDGKIVDVDYGMETVLSYIEKTKHQNLSLAICNLVPNITS